VGGPTHIIKGNTVKQSIIEPPNSVNAILVDQFVHLSRVMGGNATKNTSQELFKKHHGGNNLRNILMNQNAVLTAA